MNRKTTAFFLLFLALGSWLAVIAHGDTALYYLNFFWTSRFQFLIKVAFASAFFLIILKWASKKPMPLSAIKLVYGILFLPLVLLPVYRCCFKVPYVFCRVCPSKCPWGISRTVALGSFLILNLFGRFWCFSMCPLGTFQECQVRASKKNIELPLWARLSSYISFFLTAWMYFLTMLGSGLLVYFGFGYYRWAGVTVAVAAFILLASFFIPKFWCRYFCPIGTVAETLERLGRPK